MLVAGAGPGPRSDRVVGLGSEGGAGTLHWRASSCPAAVRWSRSQYAEALAALIGRAGLIKSRLTSMETD